MVAAREAWLRLQPELDLNRLVFLDETGSNAAMSRRVAWSPRGERVALSRPSYASNISLVGAMALDGVRTSMAVTGSIDGDVFLAFVEHFLVPVLKPGDIVVMDNLRVHKVEGVQELIEAAGAQVLYQPPYSPDLNPIELLWAWLKCGIRAAGPRSIQRVKDTMGALLRALPVEHCAAWFRHCGYGRPQES